MSTPKLPPGPVVIDEEDDLADLLLAMAVVTNRKYVVSRFTCASRNPSALTAGEGAP